MIVAAFAGLVWGNLPINTAHPLGIALLALALCLYASSRFFLKKLPEEKRESWAMGLQLASVGVAIVGALIAIYV